MSNKVLITNSQKAVKVPSGLRILIRRACNAVLEFEHFEAPAEISVTFVDNAAIAELNNQYRNKPMPTDVLSFPLGVDGKYDVDENNGCKMLGDIVISMERAQEQATLYGHPLQREVAFLTVHIAGVLTVRTVVDRIEKICRVAVFQQKGGTFLCKVFELVFELCKRICIPCEHLFSLCDRGGCNGFVEGLIAGDCLINMVQPLIVQMAVAGLMLFVLPQDGIVLGNSQCHIKPPYCFKSASSSASKS